MATTDSIARNKQVVRRLYEHIVANRSEGFAEVVAPSYVDHSNGRRGPEGFAAAAANLHRAYADLRIELEDVIAEGDRVAVRWYETGRHVGPFFDLEPTGKPFEARGLNVYRIQDGMIVESWLAIDPVTVRAQQAAQRALAAERAPAARSPGE